MDAAHSLFKGSFLSGHTHSGTNEDSYPFKRSGNAAILHGLFSQRYLVKGTCQVCDDDIRPLDDATQGGVNVRQQGWLGFTVPLYVSEGSDKTRTAVRLELELELYFYLNTVNLSDKIIIIIIIIIIKLQSTLIYINMI